MVKTQNTVSNQYVSETDSKTDFETQKTLFFTIVEKEKKKALKKETQEVLQKYPELANMIKDIEKNTRDLENRIDELVEENIDLIKQIKNYKLKDKIYNSMCESELNKKNQQLQKKLSVEKSRNIEIQDTVLKSNKDIAIMKRNHIAEKNLLMNEIEKLKTHINSNKGLLQAWNKDKYINELQTQLLKYKSFFRNGGREPISQEARDEINRLYKQGVSKYGIAKSVGVSRSTVYRYLSGIKK